MEEQPTYKCTGCCKKFYVDGFKVNRLGRRNKTCLECKERQRVRHLKRTNGLTNPWSKEITVRDPAYIDEKAKVVGFKLADPAGYKNAHTETGFECLRCGKVYQQKWGYMQRHATRCICKHSVEYVVEKAPDYGFTPVTPNAFHQTWPATDFECTTCLKKHTTAWSNISGGYQACCMGNKYMTDAEIDEILAELVL